MSVDQNGSGVEDSELEQNALITNETKKEDEGNGLRLRYEATAIL